MAARTSKPRPLLKSDEILENSSSPPSDESAAPLTKREAAKARCVSLKQAATLLNRDRNTLMKYLDQDMPYVEKADRDRGVQWVLDIADVVRWLEERAAKNVAQRLGGADINMTEDQAKSRIARAQMIIKEAEAAEAVKLVAKIHDMIDLVRKDYTELRLRLTAIPDTLAGKVDSKVANKIRIAAREQIDAALSCLNADLDRDAASRSRA